MRTKHRTLIRKYFVGTLIMAVTMSFTLPPHGWAMLAPAEAPGTAYDPRTDGARAADLKTIQAALESEVIRQRLQEFNLSPEEINGRLSQMSDEQIHQTAMQIRSMNPGGDGAGFIVSVLVIGILVLLFVYLLKRV